mmetsp:Transcript_31561/g.53258  ORF Transcript_31561/g.53258 Transcript_31561/m.53258 type:complete len:107 (-) Transcript_31561:307-627(-)
MDFSHSSQISMDELTILLLCVGSSFSFIMGTSAEEESKDPIIIEFAKQIYESLNKKPTSHITKDELSEWVKENLFIQGATNINDILSRLTEVTATGADENKEEGEA